MSAQNGHFLGWIPDGYEETGTIQGKGLFPDVTFTWRPMLQEELDAYYKRAEKLQDQPLRRLAAAQIVAKVSHWDLVDAAGEPWPLNAENLLRLKPVLFERLFAVVRGREAPDARPDPAEAEADAGDAAQAAEQLQSLGEVREARHRGN